MRSLIAACVCIVAVIGCSSEVPPDASDAAYSPTEDVSANDVPDQDVSADTPDLGGDAATGLGSVSNVVLTSTSGRDEPTDDLQLSFDVDGDSLATVVDWRVDGASVADLRLPFERIDSATSSVYAQSDVECSVAGASSPPELIEGRVGGAYGFDGVDDEVVCTGAFDFAKPFSIAVWINPAVAQQADTNPGVVAAVNAQHEWSWQLRFGAPDAGRLGFQANDSQGEPVWVNSGADLAPDAWHHLMVTYDGATVRMYVNGSEADRASVGAISSVGELRVGQDGWDNHFKGGIDGLRVFSRALSPAQVRTSYAAENAGHDTRLLVAQETRGGQSWQACVTPVGRQSDGTTVCSNTIDLQEGDDTGLPDGADEDLPYAGLFYGNPNHGDHTGNGKLFKYEASIRFRAERTGTIEQVRYQNRTLSDSNISSRCSGGNIWCECLNGGLDRYTCGYHLPNSYSLGNGGSIMIEIRADDGTDAHLPSDTVLGRLDASFVPMEIADQLYPIFDLQAPVSLEAGRLYHMVLQQQRPPQSCTSWPLSVSEAANCDRDRGLIGINGVITFEPTDPHGGPYFGELGATLITRHSQSDTWSVDGRIRPWFEVKYVDQVWVGHAHVAYGSTRGARKIGGDDHARQQFTVRNADRALTGVWLRTGRLSAISSGALGIELYEQGSSGAMTSTQIAADKVSGATQTTYGAAYRDKPVNWVYAAFGEPINVQVGRTYTLVLSAPDTAHYFISTSFPLDYGSYNSLVRNTWPEARAQYSADGGSTWSDWASTHYGRDLTVVFTLDGMPLQLP